MANGERFNVRDNAEGTVISIDGYPIQFSLVLSDEQIARYILSREEQRKSAERTRMAWEEGG